MTSSAVDPRSALATPQTRELGGALMSTSSSDDLPEEPLPPLELSIGAQQLSCVLECARERMANADLEMSITKESFVDVCCRCSDAELADDDVIQLRQLFDAAAKEYPPFAAGTHPRQLTFRRLLDTFAPGYACTSIETRRSIERVLQGCEALDVVSRGEFYRDLRAAQRRALGTDASPVDARVLRSRTRRQAESLCPIDGPCPTCAIRESADAHAMRPFRVSFAAACAREIRGLTRRLVAFFPLLALQITAIVVIVNFGVPIAYSAGVSASDPVKDEWAIFCPPGAGPSSPDCWFAKGTTPETLMRPDQIRWVVAQQVIRRQLWAGLDDGQPRATRPNLGSSLVGAAILRISPSADNEKKVRRALDDAHSECVYVPCDGVGLAVTTSEFRKAATFTCGAFALRDTPDTRAPYPPFAMQPPIASNVTNGTNTTAPAAPPNATAGGSGSPTAVYNGTAGTEPPRRRSPLVIIPANATPAEAEALISTFDPMMCHKTSPIGALASMMVSVSYASYDASAGVVTWVTLRITLPRTGHLLVRVVEQPIMTKRGWAAVVQLMIAQTVFVAFRVAAGVYEVLSRPSPAAITAAERARKRFRHVTSIIFELDNVMCAIQTGIIFTALLNVKWAVDYVESANLATNVHQVPAGMDVAAEQFDTGMSLVAFWLFFNTVFAASFFRDFIGLGRVVRVVRVAFADVAALLISFTVFVFAFVMVAMWLFGPKDVVFAEAQTALLEVMSVLWAGDAFESMQEQSPIVGGIFYVVFVAFINFFALNLLVAVLTAPLPEVTDQANLHLEVFDEMVRREHLALPKIPCTSITLSLGVWANLLMVANVFTWCTMLFPFTPGVRRIRAIAADIEVVFSTDKRTMPKIIRASKRLMDALFGPDAQCCAPGPLCDAVRRFEAIDLSTPSAAGYFLFERALLVVSGSSWRADARLLSVLSSYDAYDTAARKLLEDVARHREDATAAMREQCAEAEKEAADGVVGEGSRSGRSESTVVHIARRRRRRRRNTTLSPASPFDPSLGFAAVSMTVPPENSGRSDADSGNVDESDDDDEKIETFGITTLVARATRRSTLYFSPPSIAIVTTLSLLVIILTLADYSGNFEVAWTVSAMHAALRDSTMPTFCFDSMCTTGQTYQKPLLDVANLEDFGDYVALLLGPRLQLPSINATNDLPATPERPRPVAWDDRLVMTGPVQVRQLRAAPKACDLAPRGGNECHAAFGKYTSGDMLVTTNATLPAFRNVAWSPTCPYSSSALGIRGDYPCEGYTADVRYKEELDAMVGAWLDGQTRLVEVTLPMSLKQTNYTGGSGGTDTLEENTAKAIRFKYSIFVEWANGGGSARAWAWAVTPARGISLATIVAIGLVVFDLASWVAVFSWRVYRARKTGKPVKNAHPRWSLVGVIGMLALAAPLGFLFDSPAEERFQLFDPVLGVYAVWRLQTEAIVPSLESVAPRSARVLVLMKYAMGALPSVLPFFFLALFGFAIAGHVAFGRVIAEYSEIRLAVLTTLRAMFTGFDADELVAARPALAILFTVAFFAIVLVVLANIMLTAVTAAAEDARKEMAPLRFIVEVAASTRFSMLRGRWFELFAAFHLNARRRMRKSTRLVRSGVPLSLPHKVLTLIAKWTIGDRSQTIRSAITVTDRGRLPLPIESLVLAGVGCYRIVELQRVFDFADIPASSRYAAAFFVAQTAQTLYRRQAGALAGDRELEIARLVGDGVGASLAQQSMAPDTSATPSPALHRAASLRFARSRSFRRESLNPALFDDRDDDDDGAETPGMWSLGGDLRAADINAAAPPVPSLSRHVDRRAVPSAPAPSQPHNDAPLNANPSDLFDAAGGGVVNTPTNSAGEHVDPLALLLGDGPAAVQPAAPPPDPFPAFTDPHPTHDPATTPSGPNSATTPAGVHPVWESLGASLLTAHHPATPVGPGGQNTNTDTFCATTAPETPVEPAASDHSEEDDEETDWDL